MELTKGIVELYRKVATSLPPDVEEAMKDALTGEDSPYSDFYKMVLDDIAIARAKSKPICQDTGVPIFFVKLPEGQSQSPIRGAIIQATKIATEVVPLRPNAVNPITGENSMDNTGREYPIIYFEESKGSDLVIDLILKGGGSENVSRLYKLPDESIGAGRDLEGIRRCVLDALWHAQGKGCPPYTVTVVVGGMIDQVSLLAKKLMLRKLNEENPDPKLREFERRLLTEANALGIGPLGLGGARTVLRVFIDWAHRHPATFFVEVAINCWALRRGRLVWK